MRLLTQDEFYALGKELDETSRSGWTGFYDYYVTIANKLLAMRLDEMFKAPELMTKMTFNMDIDYMLKLKLKPYHDGILMQPLRFIPQEFRDKYPGVLGAYWVTTMKDGKIIDAKPPMAKNLIALYLANKWLLPN